MLNCLCQQLQLIVLFCSTSLVARSRSSRLARGPRYWCQAVERRHTKTKIVTTPTRRHLRRTRSSAPLATPGSALSSAQRSKALLVIRSFRPFVSALPTAIDQFALFSRKAFLNLTHSSLKLTDFD